MAVKPKWKIKGLITLDMDSEENAEIFLSSFLPEINTMPTKRSSIDVKKRASEIIVIINALDITAFRANINSILQFGNVIDKVVTYIDNEGE